MSGALTGKASNGDGTSTETWLCGCQYDTDDATGRILAERPCPRHAEPQETP